MGPTEYDVAEFIRSRFMEEGMDAPDGPVVAVNEHGADPHFDPTPANSHTIASGDWVLIDLWARMEGEANMYADITWTGYVGDTVPSEHRDVFDIVVGARDAAVAAIAERFRQGRTPQGWEVDKVAARLHCGRGDTENTSATGWGTASDARFTATPSISTAGRHATRGGSYLA